MSKIQYGVLHCHSEFSVKDSALKLKTLVETAKALGAPAVALTDHGILTGTYDFLNIAHENDVKPILGIEAYFCPDEDVEASQKKYHLILMAKDAVGYQAICRAATDSYHNMYREFPRMDFKILEKYFGPESAAHGHVIATSACAGGVLASVLLQNEELDKQAEKIFEKRSKYRPADDDFYDMQKVSNDMGKQIEQMIAKREELTAKSKAKTTGLTRRLKSLSPETEEYTALKKEIDEITAEKETAAKELVEVKAKIAKAKKLKTDHDKKLKAIEASVDKFGIETEKANEILRKRKSDDELRAMTAAAGKRFSEIFGEGNFYVELQYHNIKAEAAVMPVLADIARELGLPVVAANDIHYATNDPKDIRARTLVAAMRYNQSIDDDIEIEDGYGELYMKTDDELRAELEKILDKDIVDEAMSNIGVVVDACSIDLPYSEHYPVFVGGIEGETPAERLRRLTLEGIPKRYPGDMWTKEYEERMEYELDVINTLGYSDYLCIVQDYLDYGRSLGLNCPEGVGYTIGPGRGSAAGSIVCYLSGITSIDPMKYGLLFERFLNKERVSMPDIDSDFEPTIRASVIDYVKEKYGENAVCNIITKGTLAGKGAIRAVARVTNVPLSIANETAKKIPSTPNATIADSKELEEYCKSNPVVAQLVEDAKLVEGTVVNYGMHAAGVIISDNGDVGEYVPLMYNTDKGQWVAQCDMAQCEKNAGLLKMDFLGLRNLGFITDTLRRIKRNKGISIDIEKVPLEPEVFREIFAKAFTNAVFQFESGGMKSMLRQFKPDSMEDLILLVAAYRPGPMQYIPNIIDVKHGRKKPNYIVPGLEEILAPTYGSTIYQEQVMQIFHKIAGFSLGEADIVRKAMSKKKIKILLDPKTDYHGRFINGLKAAGATEKDAEAFWNELLSFASYAFNKSHAAAYAFIAYYTAWLKYHYPAEYMCSVMDRTDYKKISPLLNDCREMGLVIKAPDINISGEGFINVGNTIYFGLGSIKSVGGSGASIAAERNRNGKFSSMKDVVYRMSEAKNGEDEKTSSIGESAYNLLIDAGAFDAFCGGNRKSLTQGLKEFVDTTKKLKKKTAELAAKEDELKAKYGDEPDESDKEYKKALRSINTCKKAVDTLNNAFISKSFIAVDEDLDEKLRKEHELLGFYVSGNPIDKYESSIRKLSGITKIAELGESGAVSVCGIVENARILSRKSDGKQFAIFDVFDATGSIEIKCFTREYEKFAENIVDGQALCINGKIYVDEQDDGDESKSITVVSMNPIRVENKTKIKIHNLGLEDWVNGVMDEIAKYRDDRNGYPCVFFDKTMHGELRTLSYRVSPEILNAKIGNLLISKF